MGTQENRILVNRYYDEVLSGGDIDALDEMAVDDYDEHDPLPGQGTGRAGLKNRVAYLRQAFGQKFTVEDVIAEADKIAVRWRATGRHVGEFMGIPPTQREFTIAGIDIHEFVDGRMAAHWHVVDQLSLMQQLGLIPQPEQAGT